MAETQRFPNRQSILTAQATTGTGTVINVRDFKNIQLELATSGTATLTVKIQGSLSDVAPDFSASATSTNRWGYIACFNLIDPTTVIAGGTGVAATGTDIVENLLVNVDGLTFLCATVTARSAGSVSIDSISFNNQ